MWRTYVRFCAYYFFRVNCAFIHIYAFYGFLMRRNGNPYGRAAVGHKDGRRRSRPAQGREAPRASSGAELSTTNRGSTRAQGFGTRILRAILDTYGDLPIQLWCHPEPEDMPLAATQLAAWYGRFGFVPIHERSEWMERAPGRPARHAGADHQADGTLGE